MAHGNTHRPTGVDEHGVLEATAEWFSIMHADRVSDEDRQQWQAWLGADARHRAAWERVTAISRDFERLPEGLNARAANNALMSLPAPSRRRSLKLLGLACTAGVAGLLAARSNTVGVLFAQYRTGVGQQQQIALMDGTDIWLNTGTALDIDYGSAVRRVSLLAGEILVSTAPDRQRPARPFLVDTAQGSLRPLGTRFTVRSADARTNVAVFEGAVEVTPAQADTGLRPVVGAGLQLSFSRQGADELQAAEAMRRDWIHGVIAADNMRLGDFINELGRYHRGMLSCAPEVADLRLVGAFPVQDLGTVLAALEATLPVSIRQYARWWVSINKKTG